jgi:molybdenum-dependent DNA-binding transcriptional regulator ModE
MQPRIKVWVVFGDRTKLGDGRARLFELIDELGSIKKAVARMGMSYRALRGPMSTSTRRGIRGSPGG